LRLGVNFLLDPPPARPYHGYQLVRQIMLIVKLILIVAAWLLGAALLHIIVFAPLFNLDSD